MALPEPSGTGGPGVSSIDAIIAIMEASGIPHRVTSTYRPASTWHSQYNAVDFAGPEPGTDTPELDAIAKFWNRIGKHCIDIIYSGPAQIFWSDGQPVSPSFYRNEWDSHHNHVHVAATLNTLQGVSGTASTYDQAAGTYPSGPSTVMSPTEFESLDWSDWVTPALDYYSGFNGTGWEAGDPKQYSHWLMIGAVSRKQAIESENPDVVSADEVATREAMESSLGTPYWRTGDPGGQYVATTAGVSVARRGSGWSDVVINDRKQHVVHARDWSFVNWVRPPFGVAEQLPATLHQIPGRISEDQMYDVGLSPGDNGGPYLDYGAGSAQIVDARLQVSCRIGPMLTMAQGDVINFGVYMSPGVYSTDLKAGDVKIAEARYNITGNNAYNERLYTMHLTAVGPYAGREVMLNGSTTPEFTAGLLTGAPKGPAQTDGGGNFIGYATVPDFADSLTLDIPLSAGEVAAMGQRATFYARYTGGVPSPPVYIVGGIVAIPNEPTGSPYQVFGGSEWHWSGVHLSAYLGSISAGIAMTIQWPPYRYLLSEASAATNVCTTTGIGPGDYQNITPVAVPGIGPGIGAGDKDQGSHFYRGRGPR